MQRVTEQQTVNSLHSYAKSSRLLSYHELLKLHTFATKKRVYRENKNLSRKKEFSQQLTFLLLNNKSL
jgi:hypothetical protein